MKSNSHPLKTLFVSSEIYPFAKSGGLADVSYSLPKALSQSVDMTLIMPLYKSIDRAKYGITSSGVSFKITLDGINHQVEYFFTLYNGLKCYFLYAPVLSETEDLYGDERGGYENNDTRFGLFCHAVIEWVQRFSSGFDLLHLNDWQSALCAPLIQEKELGIKTIFTIHNLAYQGVFDKGALSRVELSESYYSYVSLEYYGDVNFLKAGIIYSDVITTVSPSYAKEILTKEFGNGLEGLLGFYKEKLVGILNGIDSDDFSPKKDQALYENYDARVMSAKSVNKREFLKSVSLQDETKPLFIFIGRFTWQKGLELLINSLKEIALLDINIAILGDGEQKYHKALIKATQKYENVHVRFGYDEQTSRRMYGASDFLLMPSMYEPCGLNQMIAMSYGSIPIVRDVGGLHDSVQSVDSFAMQPEGGFGITFENFQTDEFIDACKRAVSLYQQKQLIRRIKRHNMNQDFSWKSRALEYKKIYHKLTEK